MVAERQAPTVAEHQLAQESEAPGPHGSGAPDPHGSGAPSPRGSGALPAPPPSGGCRSWEGALRIGRIADWTQRVGHRFRLRSAQTSLLPRWLSLLIHMKRQCFRVPSSRQPQALPSQSPPSGNIPSPYPRRRRVRSCEPEGPLSPGRPRLSRHRSCGMFACTSFSTHRMQRLPVRFPWPP